MKHTCGRTAFRLLCQADGYHDKQELALRLRRTPAEDAVFPAHSASARLSVLVADAVAQMGRAGQVRVVASDLFGETVRKYGGGPCRTFFIRTRRQGYLAARLMVISCCAGYSFGGAHYVESR
ncbi:MAG: hypothetical protein ACLRZH_19115 [Ruthenibacterium lactatiformans]